MSALLPADDACGGPFLQYLRVAAIFLILFAIPSVHCLFAIRKRWLLTILR